MTFVTNTVLFLFHKNSLFLIFNKVTTSAVTIVTRRVAADKSEVLYLACAPHCRSPHSITLPGGRVELVTVPMSLTCVLEPPATDPVEATACC